MFTRSILLRSKPEDITKTRYECNATYNIYQGANVCHIFALNFYNDD